VNDELYIDEKNFGSLLIVKSAAKYLKRDISSFDRTEIVPPSQLFMVGTLPHSFDSRYWGFLPQNSVTGSVYPIF
jgi:conjugal transfer pilin signal peptidase TrbI